MNGASIGYAKDSSNTWTYQDNFSTQGHGLCNNMNGLGKHQQTAFEFRRQSKPKFKFI